MILVGTRTSGHDRGGTGDAQAHEAGNEQPVHVIMHIRGHMCAQTSRFIVTIAGICGLHEEVLKSNRNLTCHSSMRPVNVVVAR